MKSLRLEFEEVQVFKPVIVMRVYSDYHDEVAEEFYGDSPGDCIRQLSEEVEGIKDD